MNSQHSTLNSQHIPKPTFLQVPMQQGKSWRGGRDHLFQEKKDGVWFPVQVGEFGLITEKMRDGTLWAHTLTHCAGQDLARVPLRDTMPELRRIFKTLNSQLSTLNIRLMPEFSGGEGLEAIWNAGGEGGIAKRWDLPWTQGGIKCKRSQVFRVIVLEKHPYKASVRVCLESRLQAAGDRVNAELRTDAGWLPVHGTKFDQCRLGSILKIEAFGLTATGKLREARLDGDAPGSWLAKF